MGIFLTVFPWVIWLILSTVIVFYAVLAISGNSASLAESIRSVGEQKDLDPEQKKNFEKSQMSGRVSALLVRSNLMGVAGILSFILDTLYAQAKREPVFASNFYFTLVIICVVIAVIDYARYRMLKSGS